MTGGVAVLLLALAGFTPDGANSRANAPVAADAEVERAAVVTPSAPSTPTLPKLPVSADVWKSVQTIGLFALVSLAPAAVLMLTSFVRIQIVLVLLRQALGSPQVPGNQVLTALALLLTVLVMKPVGDVVYRDSVAPLMAEKIGPAQAWESGSRPIKRFMVDQIVRTRHEHYLTELYDYATPPSSDRIEPAYGDDYPFHVIAPAFLLSELTTALTIGFIIYLPFLVIDLVVSAVLAAMGLFMLPPTLVALPLKLILFVLADGWLLVASRLLQTFTISN
ncbi:MAG TPA: EscR/YscR/HrcR family type III secretion system export apparatus protein [Isosphaeraceae bacterium]|jgi:flagellar biosynthetic protein FliP